MSLSKLKHNLFPIFVRYPFEWRTPLGYTTCVFIQISTLFALFELYSIIITLTIGCCMFVIGLVSDLKEKLHQFNVNLLEMCNKKNYNGRDKIELKKNLNMIIQFYADARQLSIEFFFFSNQYKCDYCNIF